ncbi:MAG: hypothetical protein HFG66_06705 [Hungatella sp.]|nr:hypothetical protein [Hungatella sp.]
MENRNYGQREDIPEQIRNAFKDALDSMDFGQLNQAIGDTVNTALDKVKQIKPQVRPKPLEIRVNKRGMVSGILFTVFGSIGSVGFSVLALVLTAMVAIPLQSFAGWWAVGTLGSIALFFYVMLFVGIRNNCRIGRLKEYLKELKIHGKGYCELERLEKNSSRSLKYIRKDLKKMLKLGMLPDARMDDQETCLLLNEETYQQYRLTQDSLIQRQQEQQKKQTREREVWDIQEKSPAGESIARGREYMETLDRLRESIPDREMTGKLERLDAILEQLFEALKKQPDQVEELDQFMEYYLPTTVKLVTSYQEFAAVEFPGDNVKRAKKEIRHTLDTINGAFEKLLDDFYQDKTFDVLSDASVLQSMLAREGLTASDFRQDED